MLKAGRDSAGQTKNKILLSSETLLGLRITGMCIDIIIIPIYHRTGFNCIVKRLRLRVLKANCESNYCDLGSPVSATPMHCLLNAF